MRVIIDIEDEDELMRVIDALGVKRVELRVVEPEPPPSDPAEPGDDAPASPQPQ